MSEFEEPTECPNCHAKSLFTTIYDNGDEEDYCYNCQFEGVRLKK